MLGLRRPLIAEEPDLAMIGRIVLETREAMRRIEEFGSTAWRASWGRPRTS